MVVLVHIPMNFGSYRSFFFFFFFFSFNINQKRVWSGNATHWARLSSGVVLFCFVSRKTWRKLMVLCNISLTCWIIHSPRSIAHKYRNESEEKMRKKESAVCVASQQIIPSKIKSSVMGFHHEVLSAFVPFFLCSQLINNGKSLFSLQVLTETFSTKFDFFSGIFSTHQWHSEGSFFYIFLFYSPL